MARTRKRRRPRGTGPQAGEGTPIDAQGAPVEGSDAGEAEQGAHVIRMIRSYRASANRHFGNAKRLAGAPPRPLSARRADPAESEARHAITAAVNAFWWAEDSDLEDVQHELMHRIGRWTRRRFGCSVHFDGQRYERRCPIAIAHKRIGLSAGYTAVLICSICGGDISECLHKRDRLYWVRGGPGASGRCAVCMAEDCHHRPDRLYRASVTTMPTNIKPREVSWVRRPANPQSRLLAEPVSNRDLARTLGPAFTPGIRLSCDLCLGGCPGFVEFTSPDDDLRSVVYAR